MSHVLCPALFISAPSSGQGKTTITCALARLLSRQGKVVKIFKTGPDYLDPQILAQASGQPVEPIDIWMAGAEYCQQRFYEAAKTADLILVEGAMGLFDGDPSSADLAALFHIPIALVMDVKGMAQTAAVIAIGLANYRSDITVCGLIANNCGTQRHRELIEDTLPAHIPLLATLKRAEDVALPERHLGLVQASEVADELELRFNAAADYLEESCVDNILDFIKPTAFYAQAVPEVKLLLNGLTIAIARDEAFSFIYTANVNALKNMGATVTYFSPIHDSHLPAADALWLPGGYPELHAAALSVNTTMHKAIQQFHTAGKPILAECGGFLYALQSLTDLNDNQHAMLGLLPGIGAMKGKRGCQGMQTAMLPEGEIRGHAHHRSRSADTPQPIGYGKRQRHSAPGEAIYREQKLTASYLHLFFPSNLEATAAIFLG